MVYITKRVFTKDGQHKDYRQLNSKGKFLKYVDEVKAQKIVDSMHECGLHFDFDNDNEVKAFFFLEKVKRA